MGNSPASGTGIPASKIRDLSEFCETWPDLRGSVIDFLESGLVSDPDIAASIRWLCHLSDRVHYQAPSEDE